MRRICAHIIFIVVSCLPLSVFAQANPFRFLDSNDVVLTRVSPLLKRKMDVLLKDSLSARNFVVVLADGSASEKLRSEKNASALVKLYDGIYSLRSTPAKLFSLIRSGIISFADEYIQPVAEGGVISHDFSVNSIHASHQYFRNFDGSRETVSVKENRMDTTDIDLAGKYRDMGTAASLGSTHATVMTTLIAGKGNTSYKGKGVAWKAGYTSSDFATVFPDANNVYLSGEIRVQNHSYGTSIQSYYGANARAFDISANQNRNLLHVFSSGNSGTAAPPDGRYMGMAGISTLTGNMKMAKNVLVVGAIDSSGNIPAASSGGPAYDGRVKPDLVAYGEDGSSGAAALVSGAVAVLQQVYSEKYQRHAGSDLLRAVLINSAEDAGLPGPDYRSGFGSLNLYRSVQSVSEGMIFRDTVFSFSESVFALNIPPNSRNLRITLCWNDPAAVINSAEALVNDLDLSVYRSYTTEIWNPWILQTAADRDLLFQPAVRGRDSVNNTEQVTIDLPDAGEYLVRVKSNFLVGDQQDFSIAWQYDEANYFKWLYPAFDTKLEAESNMNFRWQGVFDSATSGKLEWSSDSITWNLIGSVSDLNKDYFSWRIPVASSSAWFRMIFTSDTIVTGRNTINPVPVIKTGWICDSALIYWNRNNFEGEWAVFRYNGDTMQQILRTRDSAVVIPPGGSGYLAVAPVFGNSTGLSSFTTDITQQGSGCYINSFIADLVNDNQALLRAVLGSLYDVKSVRIIKLDNPQKEIYSLQNPTEFNIEFTDPLLHNGTNLYQLELELNDGRKILSEMVAVYYTGNFPHIIFPNPVQKGQSFFIMQKDVQDLRVQLFDATGRLLNTYLINDRVNSISTQYYRSGWYYLLIIDEDSKLYRYKIIVL